MRVFNILSVSVISLMTLFSCSGSFDYKAYYNEVLVKLSSEDNYGRSNYCDGDIKAARIIMDYASGIKDLEPLGDQNPSHVPVQPPYKSLVSPSDAGRWASQPNT
ncbi:MAG: hypothetical protein MJZ16_09660, partial [Bacteroidales bacterium]|nr:hypothetical protein [Bacteroidales bacterium]